MAIGFVNSNSGNAFNVATTAITLPTVTSGNEIVVLANFDDNSEVSSVTDAVGTAYGLRKSTLNGPYARCTIWSGFAGGSGSPVTITVNFPVPISNCALIALQYSGVASRGATAGATGNSTQPSVSLTIAAGGNWLITGASSITAVEEDFSPVAGNLRAATHNAGNQGGGGDSTASVPQSVTWTVNTGRIQRWATSGYELIPVEAPAPPVNTNKGSESKVRTPDDYGFQESLPGMEL